MNKDDILQLLPCLLIVINSAPTVVKLINITNGSIRVARRNSTLKSKRARAINRDFWSGAVRRGDIARIGVYVVEACGIFKIGEIIGRRSLVRYNVN
ncbi:hypothetical protein D9758_016806 [Tetrapyrgos nigripes]|uniref:Uncharacterized protein n=1 Tax=Tetrapyrgos nigripes TaxID=182062 RepID=A0A8H5CHG0_9AGAR|nr:hypothetical protein D9758_016806 [Tetrapyrgos nigripes]